MTLVGKILVFVNLVLSMTLFAWALGLYTQRIDWAPRLSLFEQDPNRPGKKLELAPGVLREKHAEIEKLLYGQKAAEARWQENHKVLQDLERLRPIRQAFYADELLILAEGRDRNDQPAKILEMKEVDGVLVIEREGRPPLKIMGEDAKSIAQYHNEHEKLLRQLAGLQEDVRRLILKEEELTIELNGGPNRRGLRADLLQQEAFLRGSEQEFVGLAPMFYHIREERKLLQKRQAELEKRLVELGVDVASVTPP
jgi:hypothetical protein